MAQPGRIPSVTQDPTDPAFVQNPYDFYRHIRSLGEVVFWSDYNRPVATTYASVAQVLKHPDLGRAVPADQRKVYPEDMKPFYELERHSLLELDGPDHLRLRRLVADGFSRTSMALIAADVSQIADSLIDAFPKGEPFDLLEAYSQPLTAMSIASLLGIGRENGEKLHEWSGAMVAMYQARRDCETERAAARAACEFSAFVDKCIAEQRKSGCQGMLANLMIAETNGLISTEELQSTVILVLNAGLEATAHSIGNAVDLLMRFPERRLALMPENIEGTVEECLRFAPPLHLFWRYANKSVRIGDTELASGSQIGCLLGSSSRDDAVWPDGEVFDPFRLRARHQSFGVGLHACVGAALARLELQIALPALFSRCPDIRIAAQPKVANLYHFHGFERLDVQLR